MSTIIRAIKERLSAHVIIMNASTIVPGDQVTNYAAQPKTWARSIHQLNFALIELSIAEGISIIDVDRIAAESGGLAEVAGVFDYSSKIYTNIAREILRVMGEIGFFEKRPLVPQVGQR